MGKPPRLTRPIGDYSALYRNTPPTWWRFATTTNLTSDHSLLPSLLPASSNFHLTTMPTQASLHVLIAHYLATNYPGALPSFLSSTGTPPPDLSHPPVPDLQTLVSDGQSYELARQLGSSSLNNVAEKQGWDLPLEKLAQVPLKPGDGLTPDREIKVLTTGNLLALAVGPIPERRFDTATAEYRASWRQGVVVSSADKGVRVLDYETGEVSSVYPTSHHHPC